MIFRVFICFLMLQIPGQSNADDIDYFAGLEWTEADEGQPIRLLGIYPSDLPENIGTFKILSPNENPANRYGDLLAHVIMDNGVWLQEELVADGRAMVMPVYDHNPARLTYLRDIEDSARKARLGLWGARPIVCAGQANKAYDSFSLVQGRVLDAANVRGTIYLNFGAEWREDFTIKIERAAFNSLPEAVQAALQRLTEIEKPDIVVEARGWVFFSGGPMINVKTAAQFDILAQGSDKIIEGCAS